MKTKILSSVLLITLFVMLSIPMIFLSKFEPKDNALPASNTEYTKPMIIIDAGHGGEDGGTVGINGLVEKEVNLEISFLIRDILTVGGYQVVMTRSEDILLYDRSVDYKGRKKALDLAARVKIAELYDDPIFVSIHMNSFPDEKYSGLQVYYSKNDPSSKLLAESVQSTVASNLQKGNTRKIKAANDNIFVLDRIKTPAILIECGFLSNAEECAMLNNNEYKQKLAFTISLAIVKFITSTT